jgi:hypothetical protein
MRLRSRIVVIPAIQRHIEGWKVMKNWKGFGWKSHGLILRYYPGIHIGELRKTTKNHSQDNGSPDRDWNTGPNIYEAGV